MKREGNLRFGFNLTFLSLEWHTKNIDEVDD